MIVLLFRMIFLMGLDDGSWFLVHDSRFMAHGQEGAVPAPNRGGAPGLGLDLGRGDPLAPGPDWPPLAMNLVMSHHPDSSS